MSTTAIDLPVSSRPSPSREGRQASRAEESLYVAVTRAWYRMHPLDKLRECPLHPYVFGPAMSRTTAKSRVDPCIVAKTCAELASLPYWLRDSGESLPLVSPACGGGDPCRAWWRKFHGSELGLHYVELGVGTLEFLSVARRFDLPPIEARTQP